MPSETAEATQEATPTPEPTTSGDTVTLGADGTVKVTLGDDTADVASGYAAAFDGLVKVIIALIAAGGVAGVVYLFRNDPQRAKAVVNTGLTFADFLAGFTPSPADNIGLAKLREEFNKAIDLEIAKRLEPTVKAAVLEAIEEGKAKLRAENEAKLANTFLNVAPPTGPA